MEKKTTQHKTNHHQNLVQKNLKEKKLKKSRMDLDLLELSDFCDKRELVKDILGLGDDFTEELKDAEELRKMMTFLKKKKEVGVPEDQPALAARK